MKRRHLLLMLLCCLIPIGAIAVALAMGVPMQTGLLVGLLLLCPLLHVLMMGSMDHQHAHSVTAAPGKPPPGEDPAGVASSTLPSRGAPETSSGER